MTAQDPRPTTAVLHQFTGIGDLVWHVQYFKQIATQSQGGQVTVIAQPSTMARAIIGHEPWVKEILDHDHRPRRGDGRQGAHAGLRGIWRMAQEIKTRQFDRLILFSGRPSRGLLAALSGVPIRLGYGYNWLQRIFLTQGPYIQRYRGKSVAVLKETTSFAIAQGFCSAYLVPRLDVPPTAVAWAAQRTSTLPGPFLTFAVGTSEPHKQWGAENYIALGKEILSRGVGIVILGGKSEAPLCDSIQVALLAIAPTRVLSVTDASILGSAAIAQRSVACIGNDTGMVNIAAAVARPTFIALGHRPMVDHDPLIHALTAPSLAEVTVQGMLSALIAQKIVPGTVLE